MKSASQLVALSAFTRIAVIVLLVTLVIGLAAKMATLPFVDGDAYHNIATIVAFWATLLTPGFYLCALWAVSNVFVRIDKGDAFGPAMVKGLREIGLNLILGAVSSILIVPTLSVMAEDRFRGARYHLDITSATIGLLGLLLFLLARQGQALKAELDDIV